LGLGPFKDGELQALSELCPAVTFTTLAEEILRKRLQLEEKSMESDQFNMGRLPHKPTEQSGSQTGSPVSPQRPEAPQSPQGGHPN